MVITLGAVVFLATFIEGTLSYLFKPVDGQSYAWLKYVALAFGVAIAIAYRIDVLAYFGILSPVPYVGFIITGIVIGRGSNYVNDVFAFFRK